MADKIQMRRDTAANWVTYNPILADGEWGLESDTKKCKIGNGTAAWSVLDYISLGGDAVNVGYNFTNGQLEANCDDWNLYADAAGTVPVDGTGGTAIITKAWNGTSTLNGKGDMIITKPASNCQGNGVSKNFSIDQGQLGKVAQIDFDYIVPSAYVSGYANVSLYDITNSKLVPVSVSDIAAAFGSIARHSLLFVPNANSNNYRLCIHVADSTSTAWTIRADNFQIGNWETFSAPVISLWNDYTPVFTGLGTVTVNKAQWKRDGEDLLISVKATVGTSTATEAQMTLPSVYTSRSNVPTIEKVGTIDIGVASANQFYVLSEASKGYVTFGQRNGTISGLTKQNGSTLFLSGQVISFDARIPCAQFSVNSTFVGMNEPFYLSNSETVANTTGVVGKTKLGMDGSPLLAHTAATYMDCTLPRNLLPNETFQIQVRSKIDGNWFPVEEAFIPSIYSRINSTYISSANFYSRGIDISKITSGVLRVNFTASIAGGTTSRDGSVAMDHAWSQVIAAADGYDAWRVRIGQASTGAEIMNIGTTRAWARCSGGSTPSILAGGNIASVVRNSLGNYTFTFTNPLPHANYCLQISCGTAIQRSVSITSQSTTGFSIAVNLSYTSGTYIDPEYISVFAVL